MIVSSLSACKEKAIPLEDVVISDFHVIYEGEDYEILQRTVIEDNFYVSIGYIVGDEENTCLLGAWNEANNLVLYKGEYYDIIEANKLQIYDCDDLIEAGLD